MRLPIDDLKIGAGSRKQLRCSEEVAFQDLKTLGPVSIQVTISNASSRLVIKGEMQCKVQIPCSRCAEEFVADIDAELDEEFLPKDSEEAKESEAFPWSGVSTYKDDDQSIDLTEVLRQNALAAIPIQALCSESCKGLCAQCGANRNERSCTCEEQEGDPRLQPLRALQARLQGAKPSRN